MPQHIAATTTVDGNLLWVHFNDEKENLLIGDQTDDGRFLVTVYELPDLIRVLQEAQQSQPLKTFLAAAAEAEGN